ncbi:MAG: restriction endonuclease subunit S [Leptospiraceae bacterium]|nr:restriction endonuclease subunit S [Leptospiraceae bacterium]
MEEKKLVPELRFPEFEKDGEWIIKKLGEVGEFLKGKGISKKDVVANGSLPCIRYGELYTHYKEIITEIKSYTNLPANELILSEENDVIIPSSGETHEDIATASCIKLRGIAIGGDLNILRSKTVNGEFLAYYMTHILRKEIAKIAQGHTVVHLYASHLKNLPVIIPPTLAEQEKIAACLSKADELIQLETQKLELYKQHKSGLLQRLFPTSTSSVAAE